MVCPPVRGDNPKALASGLFPAQVGKPWYNYFISSSVYFLSMKYFVLKFMISGKGGTFFFLKKGERSKLY